MSFAAGHTSVAQPNTAASANRCFFAGTGRPQPGPRIRTLTRVISLPSHTLSPALHLRGQEISLRDIASRLVITKGKKKGQHASRATVMRMLREHDEQTAT